MGLLDAFMDRPEDERREALLGMASIVSGMSHTPNKALQQMAQQGIADIRSQRQKQAALESRNKTLSALQAAGADPEMIALAQSDPSVMSAVLSAFVSKKFATPQTTEMERAFNKAKEGGYTGSYMDFIKEFKGAGAARTQVTVGGDTITPAKPETGTQIIESPEGVLTQVPISGSSVAKEVQQAVDTASSTLQVIDEALAHKGLSAAVGPLDAMTPTILPDATAFEAYHNQIKGKAFLQAFESLKGGGQITEIEGKKAEQAIARLDLAQSEEDYKKALKDLRDIVKLGLQRSRSELQSIPTRGQGQVGDPLGIR